jgi:hypothetical protein
MTEQEQPDSGSLPPDLERQLRNSGEVLASELDAKLDTEAGLAAIIGDDTAGGAPESQVPGRRQPDEAASPAGNSGPDNLQQASQRLLTAPSAGTTMSGGQEPGSDAAGTAFPTVPRSLGIRGHGTDEGTPNAVRAWLYEVDRNGKASPMRDDRGRHLKNAVQAGGVLHVSDRGGQNTPVSKHLKLPPAEGMSSEPVTVWMDKPTGYWMVRNSGKTNTLRVQQYGLGAVPLPPGAPMVMAGEDVAIWIPVKPARPSLSDKGEAFRLLLLRVPRASRPMGATLLITAPRHSLSPAMCEALVAYFGPHLSWPPPVAPHVRQESEVLQIATEAGLARNTELSRWARNRHDVLAGRDGLFTAADWYPRLGGSERVLANHLTAFQFLVERGSITLPRVFRWAKRYDVEPYLDIDTELFDREWLP